MRIIDHNHIFRPKNKQLNSKICKTQVLCAINRFFYFVFWSKETLGTFQIFKKSKKCPILPLEGLFLKKINMLSEVSRCQGKIGQQPITKKIVLMAAKPNFLVLLPLVPFMRHYSEKKMLKNIL